MLSGSFLGVVVVEALKSMEFHGLMMAFLPYKGFLKRLHESLTFLVLCCYMHWLVQEKAQVQPETFVRQLPSPPLYFLWFCIRDKYDLSEFLNQAFRGCAGEEKLIYEDSQVVFQKLKKSISILRNASSVGELIGFRRENDSRINFFFKKSVVQLFQNSD